MRSTQWRLQGLSCVVGCALLVGCAQTTSPGSLTGWNIWLVTIDTLRADHVGFMGYEFGSTPVLDDLAERDVVFEEAIASAPVTLPSHSTLLTGMYPPRHGALDNGFYSLGEGVPTLATILKEENYDTGAILAAYVLHRQYGLDVGFDTYDDLFSRQQAIVQDHGDRRAEEIASLSIDWLKSLDGNQPFFLWSHFYDPHAPYEPPQPYRGKFATRPYDGEIAYTDEQIGRVLEVLQELGQLDRTLVIVTSDHGEGFGDGGESTHGLLLRGSTLRVPFTMTAPGALPAKRVQGTVSGADLAPTVLELLGIDVPTPIDGASLLPAIASGAAEGRIAYSETRLPQDMYGWAMMSSARSDEWAWVRAPRVELYDLVEDRSESESVHDEFPEVAERLDRFVGEVLATSRGDESKVRLDEDELEKLRALGYTFGREVAEDSGRDPKDMLVVWEQLNDVRAAVTAGQNLEQSLVVLDHILREDPGNTEGRMFRGQCLVQLGRIDEGLTEFQGLFEAGVMMGRAGTLYARTLAEAGREDEAEALLKSFMESEPEYGDHPYNLGVLYSSQERHDDAIDAYEIALQRNPRAIHVLANLALGLARTQRDPDRAVQLAHDALEVGEGGDRPRLVLAEVLIELERYDEAREQLDTLRKKRVLGDGLTKAQLAEVMRQLPDS